ncbi:hypothetical protein VTO42DRAFT_7831 [Malbranchea cinnamomea]
MQNHRGDKRGGNRSTTGKRKPEDEDTIPTDEDSTQKARTIPDLFSQGKRHAAQTSNRTLSPSGKRPRRASPSRNSSTESRDKPEAIPVAEMYNFSDKRAGSCNNNPNAFRLGQPNGGALRPATTSQGHAGNFTPHSGAKRLVVKNLRVTPRLDQERYFEKVWAQLDSALTAIFNDEKPSHSLEELYRGTENVCRQGRAENLVGKLRERCEGHVIGRVLQSLKTRTTETEDIDVLKSVEAAWSAWNARLVTIRSIFYYLDQSFLLHSSKYPVIYEMGRIQFRDAILSDTNLKSKMLYGACRLVELDRREDTLADSRLLRQAVKLFHDIKIYSNDFEPCLLDYSASYFADWADIQAEALYLANYVDSCHTLIEREMARCDIFGLDRDTKRKLTDMLDRILVADKEDVLLDQKDVLGLLRTNNQTALEQLYTLLERQDLGTKLKPAFAAFIIEEGSSIVFDQENEGEMVPRLLKFKEDLDNIAKKSFHQNDTLNNTLREAFETFINQNRRTESTWGTDNPKPGEMIAKYVDLLLRGGIKAIRGRDAQSRGADGVLVDEDSEVNKQLDQVLELFRFVHGKAVFEAFYKNDLARRLLMGRSASDEAEKGMLSRLKSECGAAFTHNLESMFKDMDLARDDMAAYNALIRERKESFSIDLNVNVLSAAAWPSYPDVPVKLPKEISQALSNFEEYYRAKYKGRKLQWKHSLAHCQLKARFPKGDKEIAVSSFQAIVLLLFNDIGSQALSYREIKDATGLSDVELKRTLQSLACAKYRVLIKKPKGKDVNDDDTFVFNAAFSDPKVRIKINQIQLKETKQENKATHERVQADRKYETQAAIVRIMKSRKVIGHQELVMEVIKATKSRGVLEVADIKDNIEKLIEKDYMEREGTDKYRYLA